MSQTKLRQLIELGLFAAVGIAASIVHLIAAIILIERFETAAWLANILAFGCAMPVSYAGHSGLTFSASRYGRDQSMTWQSARRFLITAFAGFSVNQLSIVILVSLLGLPHRPVLFVTIFGVAGGLYLASKFWAFRGE